MHPIDARGDVLHGREPPAPLDERNYSQRYNAAASKGSRRGPPGEAPTPPSPAGAAAAAAASSRTLSACGGLASVRSAEALHRGAAARGGGGGGADARRRLRQHTHAPAVPQQPKPHRLSDLRRLQRVLDGCNTDSAVEAALLSVAPLCRPSKPTLTKLISKYSKAGLWRRGLAVFKHLHLLGVDVDLSLANAALWACCRGGDAAEAWRVFCAMHVWLEKSSDSHDIITYRALFPVLHSHGMWEQCVAAYTVAFRQRVYLDGQACLPLLCALRRAGLWHLAEACLLAELAQQLHLEPFTALAAAVAQAPAPLPAGAAATDAACGLLHTVRNLGNVDAPAGSGRRCDPVHGDVSAGLSGHSSTRKESHELKHLPTAGLAGDALATQCCNVLLQAYAEATPPQPGRALAFLYAMSSMSVGRSVSHLQPDAVSYGFLALAHFRAGRSSDGVEALDACAQLLQPATATVYAQCMAAAVSAGDVPAAAALWRHMVALGVQPDDACRRALIAAACRRRVPGLCVEALAQVHALSAAACASPPLWRDIGDLLVFLAQHGPPEHAVTAFQSVLAAGVPVSPAIVSECVLALAWRDALCCVSLRQTAAAAGFVCGEALKHA